MVSITGVESQRSRLKTFLWQLRKSSPHNCWKVIPNSILTSLENHPLHKLVASIQVQREDHTLVVSISWIINLNQLTDNHPEIEIYRKIMEAGVNKIFQTICINSSKSLKHPLILINKISKNQSCPIKIQLKTWNQTILIYNNNSTLHLKLTLIYQVDQCKWSHLLNVVKTSLTKAAPRKNLWRSTRETLLPSRRI